MPRPPRAPAAPRPPGARRADAAPPRRRASGLDSADVRRRMVAAAARRPASTTPRCSRRWRRCRGTSSSMPRWSTQAYEDTSLPIGHGQTISKPSVVARMIELLLRRRQRAAQRRASAGCSRSAPAAATRRRCWRCWRGRSYSIERLKPLHDKARELLAPSRAANLRLVYGDGMLGHAPNAPYDSIIAAAGGDGLAAGLARSTGGRRPAGLAGASTPTAGARCWSWSIATEAGYDHSTPRGGALRPPKIRAGSHETNRSRMLRTSRTHRWVTAGASASRSALVLAGCATRPHRAPVEDRSRHRPPRCRRRRPRSAVAGRGGQAPLPGAENAGKPGYYTVKPGDTLIRIGLDNGQNWKDLVDAGTTLDNPNLIEVGQVLRVVPPGVDPNAAARAAGRRREGRDAAARRRSRGRRRIGAGSRSRPRAPPALPAPTAAAPHRAAREGDDDINWAWPAAGAGHRRRSTTARARAW